MTSKNLAVLFISSYVSVTRANPAEALRGSAANTGALSYDLTIYQDSSFTDTYDSGSDNAFVVGKPLYFQVDAANTINGIEFSLLNCKVKNKDESLEYPIIDNLCADGSVGAQIIGATADPSSIQAAYDVFEFKADAASSDTNTVHINCEVVLCDANDAGSSCALGCQSSKRKRRDIDDSQIVVLKSRDFDIEL